jgi:hypothetical protein
MLDSANGKILFLLVADFTDSLTDASDSKKSLQNSKRTPLEENNEPRTRPPWLEPLPLVEPRCPPTPMEVVAVVRTHSRLNANVPIVVKSVISRPTKSPLSAEIATSPLIARLGPC